jgi:CheY-like chemotaxis protein
MRILVADDELAVRDALGRALSSEGYDVAFARDGRETLAAVENDEPDAAVLDVMMPPPDGLEVCRLLRAADNTLPILMLTARREVSDRVAGLDAGADDYLPKPSPWTSCSPGCALFSVAFRQATGRSSTPTSSSTPTPTLPGAAVLDCNSRAPSSRS